MCWTLGNVEYFFFIVDKVSDLKKNARKPSALLLFFTIIGKVIFIDDVWLINFIKFNLGLDLGKIK